MKKAMTVLVLSLVALVAFGMEAKAQIPKEGIISANLPYTCTLKVLPMGQERVQVTYESVGLSFGGASEDFLYNASYRCVGAVHIVKGASDETGSCVWIRPDGDQVFLTYKGTGKPGEFPGGTWTIVGGTGKLAGIQGNGEYTNFISPRPAAEGMSSGTNRIKGQYKLP